MNKNEIQNHVSQGHGTNLFYQYRIKVYLRKYKNFTRRIKIYILFLKFIYLFLFSYNCLHFLPFPPPHPSQSHLPLPPLPSPLILSLCPLQQLLQTPLPTIPSPLPCGYCYNVLNFNKFFFYIQKFLFIFIYFLPL